MMTAVFGQPAFEVYYSRRFLDDASRLPEYLRAKVGSTARKIRTGGLYQGGVLPERVSGQADARFRFLRLDLQYRIVAVVEGRDVLMLKVGNHDEAERWGEHARLTLGEWADRVNAASHDLDGRGGPRPVKPATLLDVEPSLHEIVTSHELTDEITLADEGILEGWADGTIEDWMVFLSPVQRRAVDRTWNGPARVTGGPGTGKSVVALHRAAEFARSLEPGQKVLVTSFVHTVPEVMSGLFERLAPELVDRVEFGTVHRLAMDVLDAHGPHPPVDVTNEQVRARFRRCLEGKPARYESLVVNIRLDEPYLWDEVTRVLGGRLVETEEAYLALDRVGRERRVWAGARRKIWSLHQDYLAACGNPDEPVLSWDQLLAAALDVARDEPEPRYAAIVVDEAQDVTEIGLRFLIELLDGKAGGRILLVGDAGQRIYAGGWRLSDLGLEVRGRSVALSVCYRSTDEIMQAVGGLGRFLSTKEFGEDGLRSLSTSTVRSGPRPTLRRFASREDEVQWVLSQLDADDPHMDGTAILAYSRRDVEAWLRALADAGLGAVPLQAYRGRSAPGVKVGTYHRVKGLEFERVFLPGLTASFPFGDCRDPDNMLEKGSALYVAMSRARDRLCISHAGRPSRFLEPVAPLCDVHEDGAAPIAPCIAQCEGSLLKEAPVDAARILSTARPRNPSTPDR